MKKNLLEVKHLSVGFNTVDGRVQAVRDVSLTVEQGEVLAIVGESGCGKSVLLKTLMKLLPKSAVVEEGSLLIDGEDFTVATEKKMQKLRTDFFSIIFQDPMTALNPTIPVGNQIMEAIAMRHRKWKKEKQKNKAMELMELVGIPEVAERFLSYPWQFSGGMRQRIVLAIALASDPKLLLADEPTTALDVTVQAQMLDLLKEVQQKMGTTTIFVTHDLGVVARIADRVAVMYAGKIVEIGLVDEIFYEPRHPYTWGLLQALPAFAKDGRLKAIPGMPPSLLHPPKGDAFASRNEYALAIDYEKMPPMFQVSQTHYAATWLLDERAPQIPCPVKREKQ